MKSATQRTYDWPRPAVTVDVVLLSLAEPQNPLSLQVLLVERGADPYAGSWALPGGFVHEHEDLQRAALRELAEEAGLAPGFVEQVGAIGTPGRDPRGHTVTVLYVAVAPAPGAPPRASGDARSARWFAHDGLPKLAFDHAALLEQALLHVRRRIARSSVCFELLPPTFTLNDVQLLCEVLLRRALDRRNFRRKLEQSGFLAPVKGALRLGKHRPAQLYRFVPKAFARYAARTWSLPFY
jgi:8-oxo-dGTP diphosphatase